MPASSYLSTFLAYILSLSVFPSCLTVSLPPYNLDQSHQITVQPHIDQQSISNSDAQVYKLRPATLTDLDDITTILSSAFAGTPAWDYGYQYRQEHPDYHWHCLREQLRSQFEEMNHDTTLIRVIEVPMDQWTSRSREGRKGRSRVVSIAIWRDLDQNSPGYWDPPAPLVIHTGTSFPGTSLTQHPGDFDCSSHLDQNTTRVASFNAQLSRLRRPYIEDAYARQLHLEELATHPDFQGRGYAAELVRWGVSEARGLGVGVVTVVSAEGVREFYGSVGFAELGELDVKRLDGREDLRFEAMRWRS